MRSCSPETGLVKTTSCSVAASIGRPRRSTIIFAPKISPSRASAAAINVCSSVAGCIAASTCLTASTAVNSRPSQMRSSQRSVRDINQGITIATGARATANSQARRAVGQLLQPWQGQRQEYAEHDHAQQDQQRALHDQVVELEAVLEVDRGDHEVDRRALREATQDHAEQLLFAQEQQAMKIRLRAAKSPIMTLRSRT